MSQATAALLTTLKTLITISLTAIQINWQTNELKQNNAYLDLAVVCGVFKY